VRGQWFFNPVGLFIEKGDTVRWMNGKFGTTVTAFHPSNANHELRIPKNAKPFDSGVLGYEAEKYRPFEWTFDVEGTYDYFSRTHEPVGLVGRIVVGAPGGPAEENPPGYGAREGRAPVFAAQKKLLAALRSADIVAKKSIAYPRDVVVRSYPFGED
jgi:plastocyanin